MVGSRWRSARVYTRDDDTTPIITCTTFDSLAEHLAMSTSMDGLEMIELFAFYNTLYRLAPLLRLTN